MLNPYNIKIKVYAKDIEEARDIQNVVDSMSKQLDLIGSDIIGFYKMYNRNKHILDPILKDVTAKGPKGIMPHIFQLGKIK